MGENRNSRRGEIFNKYFYLLLILMMIVGFAVNYQGAAMSGLVPHYRDFSQFISSCFKIIPSFPTFPMWGYGFVYAFTRDSTFLIVFLQFCIALFTMVLLDRLAQETFTMENVRTLFRLFLMLSLPWFSFNAVRWPYSIAANFTVAALILLYRYCAGGKGRHLVASSCLFGIALNLRSDYVLYPVLLFVLFIMYKCLSRRLGLNVMVKLRSLCLWVILVYTMLVPYALYTRATVGHYIVTSTNGGHVLFVGLGLLPGNAWGITPVDADPEMARIMREELGQKTYGCNLQYEGDKILKRHFITRIKNYPFEYMKKVLYSAYLMLKGGLYVGEYQNWVVPAGRAIDIHMEIKGLVSKVDLRGVLSVFQREGLLFTVLYILQKSLRACTIAAFLFLNVMVLLFLYRRFYQRNYCLSMLFLSIMCYQYALCCFVYYMVIYVSNLYLIYLFTLFWTADGIVAKRAAEPV